MSNNIFIIIILLFILLILNFIEKEKIFDKKLEKLNKDTDYKIKDLVYKNNILNQQIKAFYSYLNNYKNESSLYQILKPKEVVGKKKIRIGALRDGGYVLLDDFQNIKIAYSFGICNEISFDKGLADKNIDIYMYDHTIKNLPFQNIKFHWKKIGLTGKKGKINNMKTLDEIMKENGHINEQNMILKLDIEGAEWDVFNNIDINILDKFKYIIVEFHFRIEYEPIYLNVFNKLNKSHQIFHLHCNNVDLLRHFDKYIICGSLEVSFVIRENNIFKKSTEFFPLKNIDFINTNKKPDYEHFLNIYQVDNLFPKN